MAAEFKKAVSAQFPPLFEAASKRCKISYIGSKFLGSGETR